MPIKARVPSRRDPAIVFDIEDYLAPSLEDPREARERALKVVKKMGAGAKGQGATPPPLPPEGAGEVKQKAPGEKKRMSKSKIQEKLRKKAGR